MAFAKSFKLGWCKSTEFTHYTQSLYLGIFVIGTTPNKVLLQIIHILEKTFSKCENPLYSIESRFLNSDPKFYKHSDVKDYLR